MMKLVVVVGTRPEIIKMQPVIKEILKRGHELKFVHTGQHYDFNMSGIFLNELHLPTPDYFLNVRSKLQGIQTGRIIAKCENVFKIEKPDIVLVQGDTNSALGAAIAASKLGLSVGHVEAGCRSYDKRTPEEINRVLISDVANLHYAPTSNCKSNLLREGIFKSHIFLTGHPIVDLLQEMGKKIPQQCLDQIQLEDKGYALVTVHRLENITEKDKISNILSALDKLSHKMPIVLPLHPHTRREVMRFALKKYLKNLILIDPVDYLQSLSLVKYAKLVLTDSGGIQQEAALLATPCITLRDVTEWVETIRAGINFLAGHRTNRIIKIVQLIERRYDDIARRFNSTQALFGKVGVSKRIIKATEKSRSRKL